MNDQGTAEVRQRLAAVVVKQQALLAEFTSLLESGASSARIEEAQRRLDRARAEQTRLVTELRVAQLAAPEAYGGALRNQRPLREIVLDTLNDLGVPSAPKLVSEYAGIVYGLVLPIPRFASIRRDEERSYRKRPSSRPAWVVPAINVVGLTAIPRIIANSAWETERRLIGSRTLRTNHLRTLLALLNARVRITATAKELTRQQLDRLIYRYAHTVAGALDYGKPLDDARVRDAAEAELAHVEPSDQEERRAAAARLERLPPEQQLWGSFAVVEGGAVGRSG